MNNTREPLVFLTWLKVSYNCVLIKLKDKVQTIRIALAANKALLIVRCVIQFHFQYSKCDALSRHSTNSCGAGKDTRKYRHAFAYFRILPKGRLLLQKQHAFVCPTPVMESAYQYDKL